MRMMRTLQAIFLASAALAASPAVDGVSADSGSYTQYACHFADGSPAPTNGFTVSAAGLGVAEDRCATGGGLTISLPTTASPTVAAGTASYAVPSGTSVERISYVRTVRNINSNTDESTRVFKGPGNDRCGWYGICSDDVKAVTIEQPAGALQFHAYCESAPCHGPEPGDGFVSVDQIAITLRDERSPVFVQAPTGDLLTRETVAGTRSVTFSAHDDGGGIYQAALVVNGVEQPRQTMDPNGGACVAPFVHPAPCKSDVEGMISFDTRTLADGQHDIGVAVYDASATNVVTFGPVSVAVDNHPEVTGSGSLPGLPSTSLRLVMHPRLDKRVFQHRRAHTLRLRGQMVDATGAGVSGARLSIYAAPASGREKRIGSVTTRPDGRFTFRTRPGVSQRLSIRYGADPRLAPLWSSSLEVPAPVRLAPSRDRLENRQKLYLTASLLDAKVPARSADVAFQVLIGHQWRTFATRPIGPGGRARIGHRFRVTYQRMTYRFRAVVVRRRNFPFANGTSPAIAVRVN